MKPVIIITVSALWVAVAFAAIMILNPFDKGLDDLPYILNQYDCAETFDSLSLDTIEGYETDVDEIIGTRIHLLELKEMMDNRCWIIMDSWIDDSNYDSFKRKIDYEYQYGLSYKPEQNRLILGDLTCTDIQKNPSQYYFGKNYGQDFDLQRCGYIIDFMRNTLNAVHNSTLSELLDATAKPEHPFEIEAIYYDSGNVEISFLDTSGKTYGVSLEILGMDETFQKSFPGSEFIEIVPFPNEPKYGWAMYPIVLEITHSELGNIQLKTEIHSLGETVPPIIFN
jgi:hypothetical protein